VLTAAADTVKPPLAEPAGTITDVGTVRAMLLLLSDTTVPLVAAALKYTEHVFVVGPVSVCVPHDTIFKLDVVEVPGYSVITSVFVTPPAFPVIVTLTDLVTAEATASKPVADAPAETVTEAGTRKTELLLVRETVVELLAGTLKYTEHPFDCAPVRESVPQEILLNVPPVDVIAVPFANALGFIVKPPHPDRDATRHPTARLKIILRKNIDPEELQLT